MAYTELKDPVCDLIVVASEDWAAASRPGHDPDPDPSDTPC
jgi:hypothetical protein